VHLLFSTSPRRRCSAVVCWFLLRGCAFRPDDACQNRVSWFSDAFILDSKGIKKMIYNSKNMRLRFFEEATAPSSFGPKNAMISSPSSRKRESRHNPRHKAESRDRLSRLHVQDAVSNIYCTKCNTKTCRDNITITARTDCPGACSLDSRSPDAETCSITKFAVEV
jgi:hypothetical protein